LTTFDRYWMFMNVELAGCWDSQEQRSAYGQRSRMIMNS
jgi:hypothetical protein